MVNIDVAYRGQAPGTSGWLAEKLKGARVVMSRTVSGKPAAFLELQRREKSFALVSYGDDAEPKGFLRYHDEMDRSRELDAWLGASLTPAAESAVRELTVLAEEKLEEFMNSQERRLVFQLVQEKAEETSA